MTTPSRAPRTTAGIATTVAANVNAVETKIKAEATATRAGVEVITEIAVITEITEAMGVATVTADTGATGDIVGTDVQGRGTETIRAKHRPKGGAK